MEEKVCNVNISHWCSTKTSDCGKVSTTCNAVYGNDRKKWKVYCKRLSTIKTEMGEIEIFDTKINTEHLSIAKQKLSNHCVSTDKHLAYERAQTKVGSALKV